MLDNERDIFTELAEDDNLTAEMVDDLFSEDTFFSVSEKFFPGFELFWDGGNGSTDDFPLGD